MNSDSSVAKYSLALAIGLGLGMIFSYYLLLRRGYFDLYIANKVFAGVAAVMLGLVLLIGPASRYFDIFDGLVRYRKHFGIVAFLFAAVHAWVSYFGLGDHFSKSLPEFLGLVAGVILGLLFLISRQAVIARLGAALWWHLQNWGVRIAFLFVVLHVFVMKFPSWVSWYQKGGGKELREPNWPGAGLLVGWFLFFVVVVRISELGGLRFGRAVWYLSAFLLPAVYVFTFWWGSRFA
ncbi:MAG: hypothetical protein HY397_00465 [Candidatus Doudnabacteria bacterium]|nr:hypothetical protein [Candidatus Doudnabacteria bacterium]